MNLKLLKNIFLILAVLICTQAPVWAHNSLAVNMPVAQEDVIVQWNRVLMETVRTPDSNPQP